MALKEEQLKAIDLLAKGDEKPKTMVEIAKKVGVTARTLRNWRNDPEFKRALAERADEIVDSTLYARAASGDIRAIKEYNRRFNRVDDEKDDPMDALMDATPDELRKIERDIYEKVKVELESGG